MPERLLVACTPWRDAPDYGLTEDSLLEAVQAAFNDAAGIYVENRAKAIECAARHGELVGAVKRRQ